MTETLPAAPLALLAAQVEEIRGRGRSGLAIGFRVSEAWSSTVSTDRLTVGDEQLRVAYCPSPLAFRAELSAAEEAGARAVLLTPCSERDLGLDVLGRLVRRRLHALDAWRALSARLELRSIDPRLYREDWLPDRLLAIETADSLRSPSGVLEAEAVWQVLLGQLGFASGRPDLTELLAWCAGEEGPAAFAALEPTLREAHGRRLVVSTGEAGRAVLRRVVEAGGADALATGLLGELLQGQEGAEPELARALGRFEARLLAGDTLQPGDLRSWAEASAEVVGRHLGEGGERAIAGWLERAEEWATELRLEPWLERSSWLPRALAGRTQRLAEALGAWLSELGDRSLGELEAAAARWRTHRLAPARPGEAAMVENLLRLARCLARGEPSPRSFEEAARRYLAEGSWLDRLRTALTDAPPMALLAEGRERLLAAAGAAREIENRRFAELLPQALEDGDLGPALVPIEGVLDRVVAPLAAAGRVLVVVLDGLGVALHHELAESLGRQGWQELVPQGARGRLGGVALLPSITEVCRTSLLTGERRRGDAAAEKAGFARHPGLRAASGGGLPPVLFHKGDLGSGAGLAEEVRREVERPQRRAVGVVLNVVDDQLPKGQQLLPRWEVGAIRFLEELLALAAGSGRAVVLTADHGHVIERQSRLVRHETGGARHRTGPGSAADGEVALSGPRVLAPGSEPRLIVAWSEQLRYGTAQAGYHGGASPQEMLVPVSAWLPVDSARVLQGWQPAGLEEPVWWSGPAVPAEAPPPTARAKPRTPPAQAELFTATTAPADDRLARLFASPVYEEQRRRTSRLGLADQDVARVLRALSERGGALPLAALARELGVAPARLHGLLAALQRRLNVEGFPVLAIDPGSETVTLEIELLRAQFLLEGEG